MYVKTDLEGFSIFDMDEELAAAVKYSIDKMLTSRNDFTLTRDQKHALKKLSLQLDAELNY